MNAFVVLAFVACAAAAPSGYGPGIAITDAGYGPSELVRAPAHDSASIESHRLGGNFAYSTAEAHAFARITPKLNTITYPNAETTVVHQPSSVTHVQPAPILNTHHAASPVIGSRPIYGQQALIGPVAAHTEVRQPIIKTAQVLHKPATVARVSTTHAVAPAVGIIGNAGLHGGIVGGYNGGIIGGAYGAYGAGYGH